MSRDVPGALVASDADGVAESRIRFLAEEPVLAGTVREPIVVSWRRSRDLEVAADQISLPYVRDFDLDTPLGRTADPVLRNLREQLDGQPLSIILTDPTGMVLSRRTGDAHLERHLDRVLLAPGFSYAEQFVGTNGIGTALEVGGPSHVFGHEHYAEDLEDLACAGIPIVHPITGRTVGVLDLTCWRKDAGQLLLTLARTTAEQIRQALLAETGAPQLELFQEYLRTCRRTTGVVFAVNRDLAMLNEHARTVLDPADQAALLARAFEALAAGHRGSVDVQLRSGVPAKMYYRPVPAEGRAVGVVAHVKLGEPGQKPAQSHATLRMPLPGLVGAAPLWVRACSEIERVFRAGEWLAVEGEPGVGKLAVLRAVQLRRQPVGRLAVFDGALADQDPEWVGNVRRTLLQGTDRVVVQHVDLLDGPRLRSLSAVLQEFSAAGSSHRPWVAVTLEPTTPSLDLAALLRLFPSSIEVPPLRLHLEDLQVLVSFFLARLGHGGQLDMSPEAMQLLMRSTWPGNAEQLRQMLRQVLKHRRTGSIEPDDLPPEALSVSRRLLSPLEALERDAIVRGLRDAGGSKAQAARTLGMSRATIYRKIHEYGIVDLGT